MPKVYRYRIHPAIGVARVGGSTESFDGPEVPFQEDFRPAEVPAHSGQRYKDAAGKIRRQAAIFHVYEFEYPNAAEAAKPAGKPSRVREITAKEAKIVWTVQLANLKSLKTSGAAAPITPPAVTLSGKNQAAVDITGSFNNGTAPAVSVVLGQMATDGSGLLRALPGFGRSDKPGGPRALATFDKNPGWYDDMADGPVKATVDFTGLPAPPIGVVGPQQAESAWLVTALPDFAHPIEDVVSLYDVAYAVAVGPKFRMPHATKPSFADDIYPMLHKAQMQHWTSSLLHTAFVAGHTHVFEDPKFGDAALRAAGTDRFNLLKDANKTPGSAELQARKRVFDMLRNPDPATPGPGNMPLLDRDLTGVGSGTDKLALWKIQYKQLKQWAEGEFDATWGGVPAVTPLEHLAPKDCPRALDQAHMRSMVGGAFFPGIEVGKNVTLWDNWSAPFRIKDDIPAGTLTATLAMPWQGDFQDCGFQDDAEWWPSHRPITIVPGPALGGHLSYSGFKAWSPSATLLGMADHWNELGFICQVSDGPDTMCVQQEPLSPP